MFTITTHPCWWELFNFKQVTGVWHVFKNKNYNVQESTHYDHLRKEDWGLLSTDQAHTWSKKKTLINK